MKNKALTLLGFGAKAGKLSYGFSQCLEALQKNKARLIVAAVDLSPKTKKEITFHAEKKGISVLTLKNTEIFELSTAVGHKCGVISVNDEGFTGAIKEEILNDE